MEMLRRTNPTFWYHCTAQQKYFSVVHYKKNKNTYLVVYLVSIKM